jgi:hypothetical protein
MRKLVLARLLVCLAGVGAGVGGAPREQQTPAGLAAYYKAETDKWWPIIKAANLKMQ